MTKAIQPTLTTEETAAGGALVESLSLVQIAVLRLKERILRQKAIRLRLAQLDAIPPASDLLGP